MNASGISQRLIAFASSLFGWIRGGLAQVSIGASLFFAEISGSAVADVAALGLDPDPGMKAKGYPAPLAAAVDVVGRDARGDHPAVDPDDPVRGDGGDLGGPAVRRRHRAGLHRRARPDGHGVLLRAPLQPAARGALLVDARARRPAREALWAFLLPIIILGGIFGGVVTATEGAALAVVAALFVGLVIYRELDLDAPAQGRHRRRRADRGGDAAGRDQRAARHLPDRGAGAAGARARGVGLHARTSGSCWRCSTCCSCSSGMFLHSAAAIILVVPVVMPLVKAVGIDPVHFGLIVTHQPRHRPADAAGGQRADGGLLDRQGSRCGR